MNMLRRKTNLKNIDILIGFYKDSYKKFKYWLNTYYVILVIITLSIPLNTKEWKVFLDYNEIIENYKKIDTISKIVGTNNEVLNHPATTIGNLKERIFNSKTYFSEFTHPFVYEKTEEGTYFRKRQRFLDSLSIKHYGRVIDELRSYQEIDSVTIIYSMDKYKKVYETELTKQNTEDRDSAGDLRSKLVKEINHNIDSLAQAYLGNNLIQKYFEDSENNFTFNKKYHSRILLEFKNEYQQKKAVLTELLQKPVGTLPYLDMKITLFVVFIFMNIILFISPFYLSILFFNFRQYEKEVTLTNSRLVRVSSIGNIFINLGYPKKLIKILSKIVNIIIIFLIPNVFMVFCLIFLCRLHHLFFMLIPILISFFIIINRKNRYLILFKKLG